MFKEIAELFEENENTYMQTRNNRIFVAGS